MMGKGEDLRVTMLMPFGIVKPKVTIGLHMPTYKVLMYAHT